MDDADRNAPVYETGGIDVDTSPELVWDTLTDLESWPRWMPGVKSMTTDGPFAPGSHFVWRAASRIRSEVTTATRPRAAGWRGRTLGVRAIHTWNMTPNETTGTRVETAESWTGLLPRLLPKTMRKPVRQGLDGGLAALKAETERRAAVSSDGA